MTKVYAGHSTTKANTDLDAIVQSVVTAKTQAAAATTAESAARAAADALLLPLAGGVMTGGVHVPQVDVDAGGQGVVLLTPDQTKRYGVRIDNTGALSTTLLGAANGAPNPPVLVTSATNASTGANTATSAAADTTGATLIVVAVHDYTNSFTFFPTVTDSKGNVYTRLSTIGNQPRATLFYCRAPIVGAGHTVTSTDAFSQFQTIQYVAFSGDFAIGAFDTEATTGAVIGAAVVAASPGSVTPSQGNELVITALTYRSAGAIAVDNAFAITAQIAGGGNMGGALAWKLSSAAVNPSWSWAGGSQNAAAAIATFKLAPAVVAPIPIQYGLELHIDMDREPSRPDGGLLPSVLNRAPTAHTIAQATLAYQPAYRRVNGKAEMYFPANGVVMPVQFATPQSTAERTIFIVTRASGSLTNDQRLYRLGPDDASALAQQALGIRLTAGTFNLSQTAPYITGFAATAAETALCYAGSASGAALPEGTGMWGWYNGARRCFRQQHANGIGWETNAGLTGGALGGLQTAGGAQRYEGGIRCLLDYSRRLTDAEIAQTFAYLHSVYGTLTGGVEVLNLVEDGDSLTVGFKGQNTEPSLTDQLLQLLPATTRNYNLGVVGQTAAQMLADAPSQVYPLYNPAISRNVLVHWGGTNDLNGGATAAATYANIVAECSAAQAAGFHVIVVTPLPRGASGAFETARQALRASILANWHTFANALADVGGDATIGVAGAQNNATYYKPDQIHLQAAGDLIVAGYLKPLIDGL